MGKDLDEGVEITKESSYLRKAQKVWTKTENLSLLKKVYTHVAGFLDHEVPPIPSSDIPIDLSETMNLQWTDTMSDMHAKVPSPPGDVVAVVLSLGTGTEQAETVSQHCCT